MAAFPYSLDISSVGHVEGGWFQRPPSPFRDFICGDVLREFHLGRGFITLVSEDDFDALSVFKWGVNLDKTGKAYACRYSRVEGKCIRIYMHRHITDCPPGLVVDHINGNSLDNQRHNLRVCTQHDNLRNTCVWGTIQYRGVSYIKKRKKYIARISDGPDCQDIYLGAYKTAEEAALRYDAAALVLFSEFAWLNFPILIAEKPRPAEHEIPF